MTFATVSSTSPLMVRADGAATALPAKVAGGVTYTPVVNGRVLLATVGGRLYIMGAA